MTKYAVLISGDRAESGYDEFWNDVVLIREMLLANNFEDQNIFILYADGNDFVNANRTYARYDPVAINRSPRAHRPASFTDYPATKAEVQAVFDGLANGDNNRGIPKMTENDFLFVWTFDHGGIIGGHSTLCLWGIDIRDDEFANAVDAIPCRYRVFCMQQCHSGGFIDDLASDKTVILTACRGDESAWPANNTPTQEDEIVNGVTYDHGEFNYHLISALLKQAVNGGAPANADTTGDSLVSMLELFNYVRAHDNRSEQPQYVDGPNNIGGDVHIEKEKEVEKDIIEGTVIDKESGEPIAGATVTTDKGQSDTTDESGKYKLTKVPPGDRIVAAFKPDCGCACISVAVKEGKVTLAEDLVLTCRPPSKQCVIADCADGLGLFDQECKDKEGKGYPVIDKQVLYEGKQTCKAIDMCSIQAHAGYYMIGSGGNEFKFEINDCPSLYLTMKAEKGTDTCLLLMVHDKKPRDYMRRFVAIGTTDSGKKHCGVRPAEDCFTIKDDNKWHDYTYDLRKLREKCPDAETVRIVQFYSGKLCNGVQHAFHFSSLGFKK